MGHICVQSSKYDWNHWWVVSFKLYMLNLDKRIQICPEINIRSMKFSVSVTKCPVPLLVYLNFRFWRDVWTIKVIKCPPNYNPWRDMNSNTMTMDTVCKGKQTDGLGILWENVPHINYLGREAVLFGLQPLCSNSTDKHIRFQSDNTTTVAYINAAGSTKSLNCNEMALLARFMSSPKCPSLYLYIFIAVNLTSSIPTTCSGLTL